MVKLDMPEDGNSDISGTTYYIIPSLFTR